MNDLTEAQQIEYRQAKNRPCDDGCHVEIVREDDTHEGYCRDERGRVLPAQMDDREMLTEILTLFRTLGDTLEQMGQNPMLKALMPKLGGK